QRTDLPSDQLFVIRAFEERAGRQGPREHGVADSEPPKIVEEAGGLPDDERRGTTGFHGARRAAEPAAEACIAQLEGMNALKSSDGIAQERARELELLGQEYRDRADTVGHDQIRASPGCQPRVEENHCPV